MTYDPTQPADIHNPLPQSQWPIREGKAVVCIDPRSDDRLTIVDEAKVRFYNPATHGSMVVTKGRPFFTIEFGGTAQVVDANNVFPDNQTGRKQLLSRRAHLLRDLAQRKREAAQRMLDRADELDREAILNEKSSRV